MHATPVVVPSTCLVVDDHQLVRQGMRMLIETDASLEVVGEVASGEEALELLRHLRPDIALVDATLSTDVSGFDVTEQARSEGLLTRIVIFSGHQSADHARRAFAAGAQGYISKVSAFAKVLDALHAVAAGNRYIDPAVAAELLLPSGPVLSEREKDVLALLARGMQNGGIAFDLGLSCETVKTHVSRLFTKLEVQTRAGAVAEGFRIGLLS